MKKQYFVNEVEVIYKTKCKPLAKITTSKDLFELFKSIWKGQLSHHEEVYCFYLNGANKVIGYKNISIGGIKGSVVDVHIVLQPAILLGATSICLAHNHPSNNTTPSSEDKTITQCLKQTSELFRIQLIDHLIIGEETYYSFADEGML